MNDAEKSGMASMPVSERFVMCAIGLIRENFPVEFHNTKEFEMTLQKYQGGYRMKSLQAWTDSTRKVKFEHTLSKKERERVAFILNFKQ